ncbi:hypothetical protein EJ08DRAFT_143178 [Tothia fuscella]|uniref:F-box domain-containing protein n=1 Tax=Tothia fuscella TaxID=1048955 RepID=A0A9P4P419_9PEZI|nr:hypothetical protein EJ08DRAFT_143178 [Tothia fuscella]
MHAATEANNNGSLDKLPAELRNHIYLLVFPKHTLPKSTKVFVGPLFTCKKFYNEAYTIVYSRMPVICPFGNGFGAEYWLRTKKPEALALVTRVMVRDEPQLGSLHNSSHCALFNIDTLVRHYKLLPNLQRLDISICQSGKTDAMECRFDIYDLERRSSEPVEKYVALSILAALRDCPGL